MATKLINIILVRISLDIKIGSRQKKENKNMKVFVQKILFVNILLSTLYYVLRLCTDPSWSLLNLDRSFSEWSTKHPSLIPINDSYFLVLLV